jgi:hypothetical protein
LGLEDPLPYLSTSLCRSTVSAADWGVKGMPSRAAGVEPSRCVVRSAKAPVSAPAAASEAVQGLGGEGVGFRVQGSGFRVLAFRV